MRAYPNEYPFLGDGISLHVPTLFRGRGPGSAARPRRSAPSAPSASSARSAPAASCGARRRSAGAWAAGGVGGKSWKNIWKKCGKNMKKRGSMENIWKKIWNKSGNAWIFWWNFREHVKYVYGTMMDSFGKKWNIIQEYDDHWRSMRYGMYHWFLLKKMGQSSVNEGFW